MFNDNFKTSFNCDWNTKTSFHTSSNITWLTASSSAGKFFSRCFDRLGTFCIGETIAVETLGTFGLTTDTFGVSTNKY